MKNCCEHLKPTQVEKERMWHRMSIPMGTTDAVQKSVEELIKIERRLDKHPLAQNEAEQVRQIRYKLEELLYERLAKAK